MTHEHTAGQYRKQLKEGLPVCSDCREASHRYHRRYNKERALNYPERRTPIVEVRDIIDELMGQGHSLATLATASGIPRRSLHSMLYKPERKWVSTRHYETLLNTSPPTLDDLPGGRKIGALGTRRRLRAMLRMGWPVNEVARQLGLADASLNRLASGGTKQVEARVARAVRDFAEAHGHLPPPAHVRQRDVEASRRRAIANGWASMMAWDGINIDDARARPRGLAAS